MYSDKTVTDQENEGDDGPLLCVSRRILEITCPFGGQLKPNSITLASSELASVMEFGFYLSGRFHSVPCKTVPIRSLFR